MGSFQNDNKFPCSIENSAPLCSGTQLRTSFIGLGTGHNGGKILLWVGRVVVFLGKGFLYRGILSICYLITGILTLAHLLNRKPGPL